MDILEKIIKSLNCVEVKGKENLDILLGCIIALEELNKEINKPEMPEKAEENTDG